MMIKGLYEAHLPVSNLEKSITFYESLGLKLAQKNESTAFFWIVENKSWIGLWEGKQAETPYHPSLRHLAFEVSLEDLEKSIEWLKERGIQPRKDFGMEPIEPIVLAGGAHAMIYFNDPDDNSLELIARLPHGINSNQVIYLSEWKKLNNITIF
jgi:catechol 2,3-dioxygenase-like lactoylglutathione lyase family enzyme